MLRTEDRGGGGVPLTLRQFDRGEIAATWPNALPSAARFPERRGPRASRRLVSNLRRGLTLAATFAGLFCLQKTARIAAPEALTAAAWRARPPALRATADRAKPELVPHALGRPPHGLHPFGQSHVQSPCSSRRGCFASPRHSGQRTGGAPLKATTWRIQRGVPSTPIRARLSQKAQGTAFPCPSWGSPTKARRGVVTKAGPAATAKLRNSCWFWPRRWRPNRRLQGSEQ